jgi:hypothetical protein
MGRCLALPIATREPSHAASVFLRRVETHLSQINAWDRIVGHKRTMPGLISIHLDELAELRERAAILCKEAQDLIDEYHRLKAWRAELGPNMQLLGQGYGSTYGAMSGAAPPLGERLSSHTWKAPP